MKKLALSVIVLAGLALLASCKKDNDSTNSVFKASIEQQYQNGKTAIDTTGTEGVITWSEGDEILISNGTDMETFTLQTGEGTTNGTFSTAGALAMTGNYTAAYPAIGNTNIDGTTVTFSLPATQTMENNQSGTFANGANPMVAVANGTTNLAFKNPCGGLGIRLKGATDDITVTNIRIIGGSDDILWGNLTVTMDGGDVATTSIANTATGKNIIDLTCNVTLSTTEAKRFFIVLPEGALQHGFTLEVSYGAAEPYSKSTGDTDIAQVQRNTMKSLNAITIGTVAPVVTLPAVTTTDVTSITTNSAVSGGENIDGGGGTISEYGICWSETANPTIENDTLHHLGEPLMTDYSFTMTGLDENTTYHVRAYVTNEAGTAYGEDKEFSTAAYVAPTVTTGTVAATTATTATGHVTLTDAGTGPVTEIGLCWGTENDPVVGTSNHAAASAHEVGTAYEVSFDDLTALTTYYVRAYAMVGTDYYYGSSVSFMVTWDGNLSTLTGSEPADYATATDGMTIYGTLAANVKVSIAAGATVTLDGVTINGVDNLSYQWAGITCEGNATINLLGTNIVKGFAPSYPGVFIPKNYTLTIDGTGSLNASSNGNAAGIGGDYSGYCGNITINGGVITATGGPNAAGIGGAFDCECGDILIQGGTVTATAGKNAAGIGCGGGEDATCGNITIENTVTLVTAVRGNGATYSIGEGKDGMCGTVTIGGTNYGSGATPNQSDGVTFVYPVPAPPAPTGAINGLFSVSATQQVWFSQGNLQATTSDLGAHWTWHFAEHQYDCVGNAAANNAINGNGTVSTNGSVDFFGWSTAATYYGIYNSASNADYSGDFVDWGSGLTIGGDAPGTWRTLTITEWNYLFNERDNHSNLYSSATVAGRHGYVLLPDNWVLPTGSSFEPGLNCQWRNTYTASEWATMEEAGAVFLPALNYRYNGTNWWSEVPEICYYWTSTPQGSDFAKLAMLTACMTDMSYYGYRCEGYFVRLVQ